MKDKITQRKNTWFKYKKQWNHDWNKVWLGTKRLKKNWLKNISKKLKDYKLYSGGVSIKEIKNIAKFGQGTIGQIF